MYVAIVGAGISGLACADALVGAGHEVTLFDKGRGPGGRMSTRRVEVEGETVRFDHGAQYFIARDPAFAARVAQWQATGIAARWPAAGDDAWVGTPGMNAPVRAMADAHTVHWGTRIEALVHGIDGWRTDAGSERYDAVVVAVPAEQVTALVEAHAPDWAADSRATPSEPCWTLMAAFGERLAIDPDVLRGGTADALGWAARDGAKPGRSGAETWVVQAGADWSAAHLEEAPEAIVPLLLATLGEAAGVAIPEPYYAACHRWRYARTTGHAAPPAWNAAIGVGICGDWRGGPRIEAAWLSGTVLAEAMCSAPTDPSFDVRKRNP